MDLLERLRACRIVPVLRVGTAGEALEVAGRCLAGGLGVVEFTATTTGWADAVRAAHEEWPDLVVGAGTISSAADAALAADAGAQFLVSPYPAPVVRSFAAHHDLPFLEGGFTPAEIAAAAAQGPAKLFPAHVGGPSYLRSLLAVLPGAAIVPTGGISLADVPQWLAAGALAVGIGAGLTASGDIAGSDIAGSDIAGRVAEALSGVDTP